MSMNNKYKPIRTYYIAAGKERGGCRHRHETAELAEKCRVKDVKACAKLGKVSDRVVMWCQDGGF